MAFTTTKYESDQGTIHPIRLDSERVAAAGAAPAAAQDSDIKVKISKGNREFGIRPRGVRLVRTVGTAPDTFKKYTFLPVLTPTAYDGAGFSVGTEITIDAVVWTVAARQVEDY